MLSRRGFTLMRRVVNTFEKGVRAFGKGSSYLRKREGSHLF